MNHHRPLITCAGIIRYDTGNEVRYLLPAHGHPVDDVPNGDPHHWVLESPNLLEWTLAGYIPNDDAEMIFTHEGNIDFGQDVYYILLPRSISGLSILDQRICKDVTQRIPLRNPGINHFPCLGFSRIFGIQLETVNFTHNTFNASYNRQSFNPPRTFAR